MAHQEKIVCGYVILKMKNNCWGLEWFFGVCVWFFFFWFFFFFFFWGGGGGDKIYLHAIIQPRLTLLIFLHFITFLGIVFSLLFTDLQLLLGCLCSVKFLLTTSVNNF